MSAHGKKAALAALGQLVSTLLADYRKRYANHLYYRHRTFDVKGFSTQGKFALELETVYVDLGLDPAVLGSIPQDPIRIAGGGDSKGFRRIADAVNQVKPEKVSHTAMSFRRGTRARARRGDFLAAQVVEIVDTVRDGKKVRISQKDGWGHRGARRHGGSVLPDDGCPQVTRVQAGPRSTAYAQWRQTAQLPEAKPVQPKKEDSAPSKESSAERKEHKGKLAPA